MSRSRNFEKANRRDLGKRSYDPIASFRPLKQRRKFSKIRAGAAGKRTHPKATAYGRSGQASLAREGGNQTLTKLRVVQAEQTPGEVERSANGVSEPLNTVRGIPDRCLE